MTQPNQSCCEKCGCESCLYCHYPSCKCHSVKQSWEIELEKVIIGNIKGAYTLPLTTGYKNSVKAVFSAELLRIKKEIENELEKEMIQRITEEPNMAKLYAETHNKAIKKALEIVERNLL